MTGEALHLNVGPHGSAAAGPLRLSLRTDGETVLSAEAEAGYLHRGIEKIGERMTWAGFLPYAERVDHLAPVHGALAYALAVEALSGVEVSERVKHIRVVIGELNRIASHLLAQGFLANAMGFSTFTAYALRERERINNLFEMLTGARVTYNYLRIGGVASDVTEGFIEKAYDFVDYIVPRLAEYEDLLSHNPIFVDRLTGLAPVTADTAIRYGLSGPSLRASGVGRDQRKAAPYSGYHHFEFTVPVAAQGPKVYGDVFTRFNLRMNEIEQSASIVKQALDALPDGPWEPTLPRFFKAPKGEAYAAVESPRGIFGCYVRSDGDRYPFRVKFRTPSFSVLPLLSEVLRGAMVADVSIILASFDVVASEVDR